MPHPDLNEPSNQHGSIDPAKAVYAAGRVPSKSDRHRPRRAEIATRVSGERDVGATRCAPNLTVSPGRPKVESRTYTGQIGRILTYRSLIDNGRRFPRPGGARRDETAGLRREPEPSSRLAGNSFRHETVMGFTRPGRVKSA